VQAKLILSVVFHHILQKKNFFLSVFYILSILHLSLTFHLRIFFPFSLPVMFFFTIFAVSMDTSVFLHEHFANKFPYDKTEFADFQIKPKKKFHAIS
jgi:hypothetical protein